MELTLKLYLKALPMFPMTKIPKMKRLPLIRMLLMSEDRMNNKTESSKTHEIDKRSEHPFAGTTVKAGADMVFLEGRMVTALAVIQNHARNLLRTETDINEVAPEVATVSSSTLRCATPH